MPRRPAPETSPKRRSPARRRRGPTAELLVNLSHRMARQTSLDDQLLALVELTTAAVGAERGTLFLHDRETHQLYSRVAQGTRNREIRIMADSGIAGWVYQHGQGAIIEDAYADPRFNRAIDEETGFLTRSVLCAPVRTVRDELMGVAQLLNKKQGPFTQDDLALVEALTNQASIVLEGTLFVEKARRQRAQETEFIDVVSEVSSEIQLGPLLQKIMETITKLLDAERSTLFLNDEKTLSLYTEIGQGLGASRLRFPNHVGIAGAVFTTGKSVNIPYAYADLRFNPAFDRQTGFFTRSILCVPVVNKDGKTIGVTQVLNKRGGTFTAEDEVRLKAFTAQIAISLENAKLFDDVQNMKNYNESMLESMSNGVVTTDVEGRIVTANAASVRILRSSPEALVGHKVEDFFTGPNAWVLQKLQRVDETQTTELTMDAELQFGGDKLSLNLTVLPLHSARAEKIGAMLMMEDISSEKRIKSTMARYMDPALADRLVAAGEEILGGQASLATVLFSDIRSFTTLTESLGPQGTVALLNEYFTIMVDCIQRERGMLDKFIGDAIMAVFGTPLAHEDDEDSAVRAAIAMLTNLAALNRARVASGRPPIDMGIGINTDTVVSGNIGSPKRMDYTVIGDGVNLAARLESACKQYAAHILISEYTYRRLRGTYRAREIDLVVVKGKTQPVAIYEILDYHTEETFPRLMDVLPTFQHGLRRYREGQWDGARAAFREVLRHNPGDRLAQIYIDRCDHLQASPPAGEWNGVWVMQSK